MNRLVEGFRPDDGRDVLRIVAGILVGLGLLIAAFRRGTPELFGDRIGDFGLFLILAAAAVFLYGAGLLGRRLAGTSRRWQALYTVMGALILPLALAQLIDTIDDGFDESWAAIIVFGISAAACVAAWLLAAVRFQLLLASLYGAFAFLAFLDKVLSGGLESDLDTIRWLLLLLAAALLVAAFVVRRRTRVDPYAAFSDLLTGAGLVALIAFSLGPIVSLVVLSFFGAFPDAGAGDFVSEVGGQDTIWDVLTLLVGTVFVLFGLGQGLRGPVYVGGAMLVVFTFSVGLDLDDPSPEGKLVGWPLLICLIGAALFAASLLPGVRLPLGGAAGGWFDGAGEREAIVEEPAGASGPGAGEYRATAVSPEHPPASQPAPPARPAPPPPTLASEPVPPPGAPGDVPPAAPGEPPTERLGPPPDAPPPTERLEGERREGEPPPPPTPP